MENCLASQILNNLYNLPEAIAMGRIKDRLYSSKDKADGHFYTATVVST